MGFKLPGLLPTESWTNYLASQRGKNVAMSLCANHMTLTKYKTNFFHIFFLEKHIQEIFSPLDTNYLGDELDLAAATFFPSSLLCDLKVVCTVYITILNVIQVIQIYRAGYISFAALFFSEQKLDI